MPHTIHSAAYAPWEAIISGLETRMRVGIGAHEREPQRLLIDAEIHGHYPAFPTDIGQCIDYGMLHELVTKEWPKRPHTALLELLVMELFEFVFNHAPSSSHATIGIYKPDVFKEAAKVGVRLTLTRADYLKLRANQP